MTRRTAFCTAIKWALARPNARWELVAFDAHLERAMVDWMLKSSATIGGEVGSK